MKNGFRHRARQTPSAARFPHRIDRRAIRLRPTGYGMVFLAVLGVMLAGSIRYNNNLGYLLSFLLGSMALVSLAHTRRNLEGIRIVSCTALPVFAGQTADFLLATDSGHLHRRAVVVGFEHTASQTLELETGQTARKALRTPVLTRGIFPAGDLQVSSRYPLGLFVARTRLTTGVRCLVYPRPIGGPFDPGLGGEGDHPAGQGRDGAGSEDFQGLKAYQPGDSLQHLFWKAYSRGMGLYTKEFVSATGASVSLDWFRLEGMDTEQRLGRLCDMVLAAQRRSCFFGLRLPGKVVEPGAGTDHGRRCLVELALFGISRRRGGEAPGGEDP